jgi:hypothetical protein
MVAPQAAQAIEAVVAADAGLRMVGSDMDA